MRAMSSWSTLLSVERTAKQLLEAEEKQEGVTLFEKFLPNKGGQERFFDLTKWKTIEPLEHRWTGLIGGIGCIAGETIVNGVPIAERKESADVDTMLGRSIATAGFIKGQADLYRVKTQSGFQVVTTLDHKFLFKPPQSFQGQWRKLSELTIGDLIAADGSQRGQATFFWEAIADISFVRHDEFYDLHVPIHNHYSAQGLWHHNSGKSYSGAVWACSRALLDPASRGLITANTFGQLSRATLIELAHVCSDYGIPLEPWRGSLEDTALAIANMQRCYIGEQRAFVYVLSMNSFMGKTQAARGLQVRWCLADECSFAQEKAFLTLDGRLGRGPGSLKGQGAIATSPNGFNWLYDRFADPQRSEEKQKLYVMVSCSTRENVKHLGEDYVAGLQANYTDELAAQELEGAFINTQVGLIYKYFDRKRHALQGEDADILEYDPNLPLHVSFDFNYSPAICLLAQLRGNEIHFFSELYQLDSDTWELAATLTDWIADAGHNSDIHIYGDATGAARTAASRLSNWDIVFSAFKDIGYRPGGRLHKRFAASNPPVVNRINSINCLFKQDRIYLDFGGCKELMKDFEMISWDGSGIDKSDQLRSHLSDAAGYLCHTLYPFKAIASRSSGKQRPLKGLVA